MEFFLESGVRNSFGVRYGVRSLIWSSFCSLEYAIVQSWYGLLSLIWSSFCSLEHAIVLESGMEFRVWSLSSYWSQESGIVFVRYGVRSEFSSQGKFSSNFLSQ